MVGFEGNKRRPTLSCGRFPFLRGTTVCFDQTLTLRCMIRAFGKPDLNQKIDVCLATDYSTTTEVDALKISYYPNSQSPMCTACSGSFFF